MMRGSRRISRATTAWWGSIHGIAPVLSETVVGGHDPRESRGHGRHRLGPGQTARRDERWHLRSPQKV